jgi:pantetheine-phosphate adenylyltransferase
LEDLKAFLRENNLLKRTEIVPLGNPYGITLTKSPVEALVVSRETEPTALDINEKREQKGMALLHIVVVDMIPSENHAPISTTRIRHGEIDREGHLLKT